MEGFSLEYAKFDLLAFVEKKFHDAVQREFEKQLMIRIAKAMTIEENELEQTLYYLMKAIGTYGENRSLWNVADNIRAKLKEMNK